MLQTSRVPTANCPTCKAEADAATHIDGEGSGGPRPGDLSVCAKCGEVLQFTDGLGLKLIDPWVLKNLDDKQLRVLNVAVNFAKRRFK